MIGHGDLVYLTTEMRNPKTTHIDECSSLEIVKLINEEDRIVADAVAKQAEHIAHAIDVITEHLKKGGRLYYVGAGTSGRIGMLDASECPPTFGVDPGLVCAIMAGGLDAFQNAVEGLEDDSEAGNAVIEENRISERDVVTGIAASGCTPYVIGALSAAAERGITTIGICNTLNSPMEKLVDIAITVPVGPEVLTGSTRMKAGTSQKMVLNMLTTGTMIRLGKVYENLMVDLKATNTKLIERARRIICEATGTDYKTASETLEAADREVPVAIIMIKNSCDQQAAKQLLQKYEGNAKKALKSEGLKNA